MTDIPPEHDGADLLALPDAARHQHRITKKMLATQFEDQAPADARLITKAVASAQLVGILRPETIQVPKYQDAERVVVDVPVLEVLVAEKTSAGDRTRVTELIHRSMAKPVVLLAHVPDGHTTLSLALAHVSRTDPTRSTSVIDAHVMVPAEGIEPGALHLDRLDRTDMWALYRDLVRTAAADGRPASTALQAVDAIALRRRLTDLESELSTVVRDAKRAKNQQRRIELNIEARTLRAQIGHVRGNLYSTDGHHGIA
ncbi:MULTISPECIES: DUF4391 domain-containing protein [Streptomyces]|uniref:DUF4391 domain-containing protein n=1 Tax=Streptomyces TaxID=1883 RepID=UPI000B6AE289|nr:DUF4391 domain-containing protein [Streptomyces sp. PgraA7]MYX01734.1 DUF4391 domain-containing protein [Streptomyces sp. SID8378]SNB80278.1 protein of unknown function [Streptomyces sp. PgraA7]